MVLTKNVMKLCSLMAAALLCLPAAFFTAQAGGRMPQKRFQVNVSWSGVPTSDIVWNSDWASGCCCGIMPSLERIYSDCHDGIYTSGNFSADFVYHFRKWFAIDASAGFTANWMTKYSDGGDSRTVSWGAGRVGLMARFTWVNRNYFRGYSSIGLHAVFGKDSELKQRIFLFPQFDLLGLEFGSSVFGLLEFGIGGEYAGAKVGIGYRF